MLRAFVLSACFGFVAFAASACSSDDDPPAAKYPSADSFCQAKAAAECEKSAPNCSAKADDCLAYRKTLCSDASNAAQSGPRQYKAKQAEACVAKAKETYAKSGAITPDDVKKLDEVCQKVFQGPNKSGASCSNRYECEGDLICDKGVCATKAEKAVGGFCANPGEVCATGAYCAQDGTTFKCLAKKQKGEACDDAKTPCVETLRCTGTCQDRFGSGETCDPKKDECGTTAPYCDVSSGAPKCGTGFIAASGVPACGACKPDAVTTALCGFGGT